MTDRLTLLDPGIYTISATDYHSDPAPEPSLSGSLALPLLHRSPRHAWHAHPRLNSDCKTENSRRLDLGSAAHALLLQAGRGLVIIEADNYTTKIAKAERDAAYAAGDTPILAAEYDRAAAMACIAHKRLNEVFGALFSVGKTEATILWCEGDAWCRGMIDYLDDRLTMCLDYKTTAASARPEDAERTLYAMNYHFKAAFYERGLDVLNPENTGRRKSFFLFQETDPPYECSLVAPDEGGMSIARKQITLAIETWQRCMASGEWPGYGNDVHYAQMPPWLESQWIAREMADDDATGAQAPANYPRTPVTEITP